MSRHFLLPVGLMAAVVSPIAHSAQTVSLSVYDINPISKSIAANSKVSQTISEVALVQRLTQSLGEGVELKASHRPTLTRSTSGKVLTHQRYQQYYQGVPVRGQQFVVHHKDGLQVEKLNGKLAKNLQINVKPKFSSDDMLAHAKVLDTQPNQLNQTQREISQRHISQQHSELIIFIDDNQQARLAFHVSFFYQSADGQVGKPAFIIDANDKTVLQQWDDLKYAQATGPGGNEKTGKYHYGTDKPHLEVSQSGDTCEMKTDKVTTIDMRNTYDGPYYRHNFKCPNNTYKVANGAYSPLNDVHFFTTKVHDMYNDWFGFAPLNTNMMVLVHYGINFDNAFWNGSVMAFGDGNDSRYPLTSLDVVSHEAAHGFTDINSDLNYYYQAGGINESFSDIAGEAAEFFTNGSNDWLVGADFTKTTEALRYFEEPGKDGRSISHADQYYNSMDVHYTSGVFNKAFYLLANTRGWDVKKAFEVFVIANRSYWTSDTDFAEGACGLINASDDLGYSIFDVDSAFTAVGVRCLNYPQTDTDNDGLPDFWEVRYGLDHANAADAILDSDHDGLDNLTEFAAKTWPNKADTDDDGLNDGEELTVYLTNPLDSDTDDDSMPDGYEVQYGLDPRVEASEETDTDGDGVSDLGEYITQHAPNDASDKPSLIRTAHQSFESGTLTDGWSTPSSASLPWHHDSTQFTDGIQSLKAPTLDYGQQASVQYIGYFAEGELAFDIRFEEPYDSRHWIWLMIDDNPFVINDSKQELWQTEYYTLTKGVHTIEWKHNNKREGAEAWIDRVHFFEKDADNDQDGIYDGWEFSNGLDFNDPADALLDLDGDGLTNVEEYIADTDPRNADSDDDGLSDGDEVNLYGSNPNNSDTDGDGFDDKAEVDMGLNPIDAADVWLDDDQDHLPLVVEILEATDANAKDNDVFNNPRLLVQQAYIDMKGRFALGTEIDGWLGQLVSKRSVPSDVYAVLLTEAQLAYMGFIGRVYLATIARTADVGGARYHLNRLRRVVSKQGLVDAFVGSAEFQLKYGELSNADFVRLVYQNVLGREADEAGFDSWLERLNTEQYSREGMMLFFIESQEYIATHDKRLAIDVLSILLTDAAPTPRQSVLYQQLLANEGQGAVVRALLASEGHRTALMANISGAMDDTDNDGIPDGVEFVDGFDVNVKDNDINGNDQLFVKQTLRDMVGEVWSFAEVEAQQVALTAAGSRTQWIKSLMGDNRFSTNRQAISRLYSAFFLRLPEHDGLMYWVSRRESDLGLNQIADFFVASGEFQDRYGSLGNGDFVKLVYQNLFSREADEDGLNYWQGRLDDESLSRGGLMAFFSEADENLGLTYHRGRVVLLFNLLYRRAANNDEFTTWHDALVSGTDASELIDAIINSNEYLRRFY
ncbi:MAG: DUF4214 domain-containing protein [Algicola sp.]|nr:DUF4214 domain-containing protein [Algicola sp.]